MRRFETYDLARAYVARRDRDRVLEFLGKACEAGFAVDESAGSEPLFEPLRDDPTFP